MRSTIFPVYTDPEPKRRPRPPKGEGEATRNNVVMSVGKRSCPDIICYLLSGTRLDHVILLDSRHHEARPARRLHPHTVAAGREQ